MQVDTTRVAAVARESWGIQAGRVVPIETGQVNAHWRVEARDAVYVVRQYSVLRSDAAIADEHTVLDAAAAKGWPVAAPLPATDGVRLVQADDGRYCLFPFLPGTPAPLDSQAHRRIKGRMLARLHADLADSLERQRDGFGRAWELDATLQAAGADSFNATLARFGETYPALAAAVRRQRYRNLRELSRSGYGDLPSTVIHADYHHDNLLFTEAELTGLLDFDSVRLDAPAYDIALSLVLDCMAPPDYNVLDCDRAAAFIDGYARTRPLAENEVELLPALVRAAVITLVAFRLGEWHAGINPRAVASIERSVSRRFPGLDATGPRLREELARLAG
jgi:homoserine kinase type II